MGRCLSLTTVLIVMAVGAYIYMRQAESATVGGASSPAGTVDLVGIKHDLMAIAQAERMHNGLHGGYVSLDELRSSGDLSMPRNNRGPYNYTVDVSSTGFTATATYAGGGETPLGPRTISVDQTMEISQN